jgi:hypothetical protein
LIAVVEKLWHLASGILATNGLRDFDGGEPASIYRYRRIMGSGCGVVGNGGTGMTKYTMEDEDYGE